MFKQLFAYVYKSFTPKQKESPSESLPIRSEDLIDRYISPPDRTQDRTLDDISEINLIIAKEILSPDIPSDRCLETAEISNHSSCRVKIVSSYSIAKAGNTAAECEDAYACASDDFADYFSVSDGATESSFSREWAKELVQDFVDRSISTHSIVNPSNLNDWLLPLQRNWANWLASQNLVWFAKRKAEQGTFATLIGLIIQQDLQWQAFAVGDSCLFVVRDGNLKHSFPLTKSSELGYRPYLIGTLRQTELPAVARDLTDMAQLGDRFYIVTDALAGWILASLEDRQNPWVQLDQILSHSAFSAWVELLRDRHEIVNDDTTLLHIEIVAQAHD